MSERNTYAVIGVGQYGLAIAETLVERGCQVHVYDTDEKKIETLKDDVALAVTLDCTDKYALEEQGIAFCTTVVIAIGDNFEATVLACVNLKEINENLRIIARASTPQQRMILNKLGIHEVLSPEKEVANAIAEKVINPNVVNSLLLPDSFEIAEIKVPSSLVGKAVKEVNFVKYELNLITVKVIEEGKMHIMGVPTPDTIFQLNATLLLFGLKKNIEKFLVIKS